MNPFRFIKSSRLHIFIIFCLLTSSSHLLGNEVDKSLNAQQKKPNILWLISEDNSKHYLKLYDSNGASMPNIESLAAEGLVFNNAFSNSPVCSTARSSLATGIYGSRLGTANHRTYLKTKLPDGFKAFSQIMKDSGYYTSNNSKTDYNFVEEGELWSASSKKANWKDRQKGQPFFHVQTYAITHEGKLHFKQTAIANQKTKHNPDKLKLPAIFPDTQTFRYTMARTLDNHRKVDNQMGQLLNQLKQDGELENTFIFYFGDHGGVLPGSKGYLFETGLHVPLIVRVPKNYRHLVGKGLRQDNTRVDGFVSFIDFAPTVLSLAGIEKSPELDGRTFLAPELGLNELNQRDTVYAQADRFDEKSDLVRSIRKGNYKYIRHYQPYYSDSLYNHYRYKQLAYQEWKQLFKAGKLNSVQAAFFEPKTPEALYDISLDPYETKNLANCSEHQVKLKELRNLLQQQIKNLPDLGFIAESKLVAQGDGNSFLYGKQQKQNINELIDIADLQLQPFDEVKKQLTLILKSDNEDQQYWALISLSSFGEKAQSFIPQVKEILKQSTSVPVKGRAIEFLSHVGTFDPVKPLSELISNTKHDMEKVELLNIATFLNESKSYRFPIPAGYVVPDPKRGSANFKIDTWLKVRWQYISRKST